MPGISLGLNFQAMCFLGLHYEALSHPLLAILLRVPSNPRGNIYLNKIYQEPMGSWIYTLICFNISRTPAL